MEKFEIIGCELIRERIVFEEPEDNVKEINSYVAYVVLNNGVTSSPPSQTSFWKFENFI